MSFLRSPGSSDICNQRNNLNFQNRGSHKFKVIAAAAWRLNAGNGCALERRKLMERDSINLLGFFVSTSEGKISTMPLLAIVSPRSCRNHTTSIRVKDVRACVLDTSCDIPLAVELVSESQLDAGAFDKQDSVSKSRKSEMKNPVGDVKRNRTRRATKKVLYSNFPEKSRPLDPVLSKVNRTKYVRRKYATHDAALASVGTHASVEHCNQILKELEQTCEEKALLFFNWMRTHGKLRGNTNAYNLALRVLSRMEDWKAVEMLFDEMDSDADCEFNSQIFNTVIFVCAKRGMIRRGTRWFLRMLEKDVQPNVATIGMIMGLYRKGGNLSEAEYAFDKMRYFKLQNVAAYSAMITIYTRLGMYSKSEEIIHLMKDDKVAPNFENWLVQLNAYCQQGKMEEAESVFESLKKSRMSVNIVVYNTLITGYGKVGNTKAAENLFHCLPVAGLKPDEVTYRSMVECYGRTDSYRETKWYYEQLKQSGFRPNSSNFYTMINLHARHDDESGAIQTLLDMKEMDCQLSSITTTIVQAYERVGKVDKVPAILRGSFYGDILLDPSSCSILALAFVRNSLLDEVLTILKDKRWKDSSFEDNLCHTLICYCKEAGRYEDAVVIFTEMPNPDSHLNLHIACSLIDVYSCMNRFDLAEALYLKLKSASIPLDMVTYSVVVRMYAKSGSLKDACLILDMIEKCEDIQPDIYLYRDMLRIYQQCNLHEKLANVYYKLLKRGDLWDEAMYNCVINCCGRALPVDEVSKLFDEMIRHGYAASTITFNVILDIYGKAGLLKKAEKVFQTARKLGLVDVISYNTLIAAYGQHKDFKSMNHVVQQMQYAGYQVSLEAYNCMLDAYGKAGMLEEFDEVLQKMEEGSCASDHYTYNIMINIYGKRGWIEDVSRVLAELRRHGLEPDVYSYNSLIKAYGIAGMPEEAVGILNEMRRNGLQPDRVTFINLITTMQRNENYLEAVKWSLWLKQMEQKV